MTSNSSNTILTDEYEPQNLLIIGNGFDLACKLKSAYIDYYEEKIKDDVEEYINSVFNGKESRLDIYEKNDANNIWSIVFSLQYCFVECDMRFPNKIGRAHV